MHNVWQMADGNCSKEFPKDFAEEKSIFKNGYPQYRRGDNCTILQVGNSVEVDNNPYVSKKV